MVVTLTKDNSSSFYVYVSPTTGKIVGEVDATHNWLFVVGQIHYYLLMGRSGLIVNGVGAAFLFLLTLTGIVLWWPGVRHWKRGLGVKFSASWRRINFDLHSAIGFWTLLILSVWSVSSIYFAWPKQFTQIVDRFSSTASMQFPPANVEPPARGQQSLPLAQLIQLGSVASPNATLYGLTFPRSPKTPLTVLMARAKPGDFSSMDYVLVDPYRGRVLDIWHRGENPTWGSRLIFNLGQLHFGTAWGITVKIIWSLFGISLAVLSVTGILMYWNQYLGKRWKGMRSHK